MPLVAICLAKPRMARYAAISEAIGMPRTSVESPSEWSAQFLSYVEIDSVWGQISLSSLRMSDGY